MEPTRKMPLLLLSRDRAPDPVSMSLIDRVAGARRMEWPYSSRLAPRLLQACPSRNANGRGHLFNSWSFEWMTPRVWNQIEHETNEVNNVWSFYIFIWMCWCWVELSTSLNCRALSLYRMCVCVSLELLHQHHRCPISRGTKPASTSGISSSRRIYPKHLIAVDHSVFGFICLPRCLAYGSFSGQSEDLYSAKCQ